jgi:hypothetical protein
MKPSQVNKLFTKLTPHEQAVLAFEALSRHDINEIEIIVDSVPREKYLCVHTDYQTRAAGLQNLVRIYGTEYWKNRALMMMALHASDNPDGYEGLGVRFAAKLASMNSALIEVCQLFKVDIQAVKIQAQCKGEPTFNDYADSKLIEQYTELFTLSVMTYAQN